MIRISRSLLLARPGITNLTCTRSTLVNPRQYTRSYSLINFGIDRAKSSTSDESNAGWSGNRQPYQKWMLLAMAASAISANLIFNFISTEKAVAQSAPSEKQLFHGFSLKLYMYHGCPFCAKVEAFLKYQAIPYTRVEVSALTKRELKPVKKRWGYKKVPALIMTFEETGDQFLIEDSQRAISLLESFRLSKDHSMDKLEYLNDKCYSKFEREAVNMQEPGSKTQLHTGYDNILNVMYEESKTRPTKEQIANNMKWRKWIEEKFLHTIAPNLYRNYSESIANTKHYISISPRFNNTWAGSSIVYTGGPVMKIIGDRVAKKWCISKEPRDDLYKYINEWATSLPNAGLQGKRGKKGSQGIAENQQTSVSFMSDTEEPSIADLEMFGLLAILEGTRVWPDIVQYTTILPWYRKMRKLVSERCGQDVNSEIFIAEESNCGELEQSNCDELGVKSE